MCVRLQPYRSLSVRHNIYLAGVIGRHSRTPSEEDIARAFIDLHRVLDRIRRGELEAGEHERERIASALDALRDLRSAA